ncbi:MAG: EF-P lysine aminoacylase EpmA [Planctomycetaceae bacterium]
MTSPADWRPTASFETLRARAEVLDAIRRTFRQAGYLEVETPLLSQDVCVDAWLEPFVLETGLSPISDISTHSNSSADSFKPELYLQTSPEFAMKRLLAAGAEAIFQIARCFRRDEFSPRHNPEFTMIEWYRTGDTFQRQMDFVEQLVRSIGLLPLVQAPPRRLPAVVRMTYDEAFEQFVGQPILGSPQSDLVALAKRHGVVVPQSLESDDRDGWLNLLLAEVIEPQLLQTGPLFIYGFPPSQAALARVSQCAVPTAERFELYLYGIEICNGYQELTDPVEFRRRMADQNARRREEGLRELREESRLLDAMQAGFPDSSGVALGFDRLLMWRLGLTNIEEVIPFPSPRA